LSHKTNEIVKIENIMKCNEQIYIYFIGRFREKYDLFSYPFFSKYLNIYCEHSWITKKVVAFKRYKKKIVLYILPFSEKYKNNNNFISKKCLSMPHSETL